MPNKDQCLPSFAAESNQKHSGSNNNNVLLFFIVFVGQDLEKSLTGDVYLGSSMQCSHVLVEPGGPTKGFIGAGASASQEAHSHGW